MLTLLIKAVIDDALNKNLKKNPERLKGNKKQQQKYKT